MSYVAIWSFDNYVPAHIAVGRLKEEGIECWLKDENAVTIDPLLTNAIGGIKLMVEESDAERALQILNDDLNNYKKTFTCPKCGSHDVQLVSTPRKPLTLFSAIGTFLLGNYALNAEQVYHCFNCENEFPEKDIIRVSESA